MCEDAISIKKDKAGDQSWIIGGGAYHASDKVVQHNGCGTVNIINFYVEDYGKLYRSCGNVSFLFFSNFPSPFSLLASLLSLVL